MLLQYKGATGEQVVYVNEAGLIVQAPVISTTNKNSVEMVSAGDRVFAHGSGRMNRAGLIGIAQAKRLLYQLTGWLQNLSLASVLRC
jgi:hypothetical protein